MLKVAYKKLMDINNFQINYLNLNMYIYILKYVLLLHDDLVKGDKPSKNNIFLELIFKVSDIFLYF